MGNSFNVGVGLGGLSQGRGMDWEFGVVRCKLFTFRMDKQQVPTVEHRELYPVSWDKP